MSLESSRKLTQLYKVYGKKEDITLIEAGEIKENLNTLLLSEQDGNSNEENNTG